MPPSKIQQGRCALRASTTLPRQVRSCSRTSRIPPAYYTSRPNSNSPTDTTIQFARKSISMQSHPELILGCLVAINHPPLLPTHGRFASQNPLPLTRPVVSPLSRLVHSLSHFPSMPGLPLPHAETSLPLIRILKHAGSQNGLGSLTIFGHKFFQQRPARHSNNSRLGKRYKKELLSRGIKAVEAKGETVRIRNEGLFLASYDLPSPHSFIVSVVVFVVASFHLPPLTISPLCPRDPRLQVNSCNIYREGLQLIGKSPRVLTASACTIALLRTIAALVRCKSSYVCLSLFSIQIKIFTRLTPPHKIVYDLLFHCPSIFHASHQLTISTSPEARARGRQ